MAIPTDFKGPTPVANTTKSFKLFGSATVGIWALDIDGTLSATSYTVPIGPGLVLFMDQAYTDAALVPLVKEWLARATGGHLDLSRSGGKTTDATKQAAVTATTCT